MIFVYRVFTNLLYPFLIVLIYLRILFNKEDKIRYKEKIFTSYFNIKRKSKSKLIWFHASSIGEFKSIIPIINELKKSENLEFLITTTTLSSSILAEEEFKNYNNIHHRFIPLDIQFLINKFLVLWKPTNIFLVDSEVWPNLILIAKEKKIPIALINARITSRTFKRWMKFPSTAKKIFSKFDLCLASNNESKKYLEKLAVTKVFFNGNIKLINNIDEKKIKNLNEKLLTEKKFWFAASTHRGEELFCLKVHNKIKEKYKDILTIIAPRHIDKAKKIETLSKNLGFKTQLLNKNEKILSDREVVIINSFGVLQDYFKYAKSVFIGKSILKKLKNEGGQNPIDAAKLKCRIYHGPYVYNFEEIYKILRENNISQEIKTYDELSNYLIKDLNSSVKINTINSSFIEKLSQKTLEDTMKSIKNFIK